MAGRIAFKLIVASPQTKKALAEATKTLVSQTLLQGQLSKTNTSQVVAKNISTRFFSSKVPTNTINPCYKQVASTTFQGSTQKTSNPNLTFWKGNNKSSFIPNLVPKHIPNSHLTILKGNNNKSSIIHQSKALFPSKNTTKQLFPQMIKSQQSRRPITTIAQDQVLNPIYKNITKHISDFINTVFKVGTTIVISYTGYHTTFKVQPNTFMILKDVHGHISYCTPGQYYNSIGYNNITKISTLPQDCEIIASFPNDDGSRSGSLKMTFVFHLDHEKFVETIQAKQAGNEKWNGINQVLHLALDQVLKSFQEDLSNKSIQTKLGMILDHTKTRESLQEEFIIQLKEALEKKGILMENVIVTDFKMPPILDNEKMGVSVTLGVCIGGIIFLLRQYVSNNDNRGGSHAALEAYV